MASNYPTAGSVTKDPFHTTIEATEHTITPGVYSNALAIIAQAFANDPLTYLFVSEVDSLLDPPVVTQRPVPIERTTPHFAAPVRYFMTSGNAFVMEAGNWAAMALWELNKNDKPIEKGPSSSKDQPSAPENVALPPLPSHPAYDVPLTSRPVIQSFIQHVREMQAIHIPHAQPFYNLFILARNVIPVGSAYAPHEHVAGAVSACVKPILQRARKEGRKAWLEASSERSMTIYKGWGFKVVGEFEIGTEENKVKFWTMIWE